VANPPVDFVALALASPRRAFVVAAPFTFIISDGTLPRLSGPHRTVPVEKLDVLSTQDAPPGTDRQSLGRSFMALALRKVSDTFPHMITLGRTGNNDLVVADSSISKLHAIFTHSAQKGFELADAGSKNGTWVAGRQLVARGEATAVRLGDRIRVGRIEFTVVDPGACWDTVDRMRR
jgi:FHA domain